MLNKLINLFVDGLIKIILFIIILAIGVVIFGLISIIYSQNIPFILKIIVGAIDSFIGMCILG